MAHGQPPSMFHGPLAQLPSLMKTAPTEQLAPGPRNPFPEPTFAAAWLPHTTTEQAACLLSAASDILLRTRVNQASWLLYPVRGNDDDPFPGRRLCTAPDCGYAGRGRAEGAKVHRSRHDH